MRILIEKRNLVKINPEQIYQRQAVNPCGMKGKAPRRFSSYSTRGSKYSNIDKQNLLIYPIFNGKRF
jgi:hypothetical protein